MNGLYIHIPFCVRKCAYCDFVSTADHSAMGEYLNAVKREMGLYAQKAYGPFSTVFIGGGTPSVLPPGAIAGILEAARGMGIAPGAEISMESNPGTLTPDKLSEYRAAGVNRLSMGLQSSDDRLLARVGRIHTYAQFLENYKAARAAGFDNVNVDVMYGLPGQTRAAHRDTLLRLCALEPEHISAYSLILEEGTPLFNDHADLPDEDESYAMHRDTIEILGAHGYTRYEISNYARPGRECRHNLIYWDNGPYLGVGLNAHSARRIGGAWTRFFNAADMGAYLAAMGAGRLSAEDGERIPPAEEMFECVMLGLRKVRGMDLAAFQARFGRPVEAVYPDAIRALLKKGWLATEPGRLRLTDRGLDMQNQALLAFME